MENWITLYEGLYGDYGLVGLLWDSGEDELGPMRCGRYKIVAALHVYESRLDNVLDASGRVKYTREIRTPRHGRTTSIGRGNWRTYGLTK